MSDNQSDSSQDFQIDQINEEDQPQVKEALQKGKKILPSYAESALYTIFKQCYNVDSIFFNKLNIIAKRLTGDLDNDGEKKKDEHWINVGRKVRAPVNRSNYNFLQDKQLIRRAEEYLKNKKLLPQRRPNPSFNRDNERQQKSYVREDNNRTFESRNQNRTYEQRRPKQKFVQKIQNKQTQPEVNQKKPVETPKVEVNTQKKVEYKQKAQTFVETQGKVQPKKKQTTSAQVEVKKTFQQVPKAEEHKKVEPKKEEKKPQTQQPKQQPAKKLQNPTSVTGSTVSSKIPQKVSESSHRQTPKQVEPVNNSSSITSSHSIPTIQNFNPTLANGNFEQACTQNSFILKFIQPQAYPQRISYVRTADGAMKNVQIRVTGISNQGSQKGI